MVVVCALAVATSVGGGGVERISGVRPTLAMVSGPTACMAILEELWRWQGVVDGVL